MSASPAEILRQIDLQEPKIRRAFVEYVQSILSGLKTSELERLIDALGIDEIADVLGLNASALAPLVESIRAAAVAGGTFEAAGIRVPPRLASQVRFRFDMRHPIAERWMSQHGAELVTNILADQRNAIRTTVTESLAAGRGPRQTALDIIGRVDRATGRRTGGIVGLTNQQSGFVANARTELGTLDGNYFTRQLRDRRFDSLIRRHMTSGEALSPADIDRIIGRYSDRMLAYRGEVISRTESLTAFNEGRDQTYQQAIANGDIRADAVEKAWKSASDKKVRDSHRDMHNQRQRMANAFESPSGARLMFPGDTSLGAGASEVAQCRCVADYKVDWLAQELG